MRVEDKTPFKGGGFYNLTSNVQNNTLLNRGLVDIGGCAIPQALMSNNRDEAIERATMSAFYFSLSFFTPFFLLPLFNKKALFSQGIVKDFSNKEKKIMQVSKKYLTKGADYLVEGIREKGKELKCEKDFENILNRFTDKNDLHKKLSKAHEIVFRNDFLSTAWMWCSVPYIATGITEKRTNKKGFSASFDLTDQSKIDENKYKRDKRNKLITSALIATIPPILAPKYIMRGITGKNNSLLKKYAS